MRLNDKPKEDAIYDWILAATGLVSIWSHQTKDLPPKPYISINITSGPAKTGSAPEKWVSLDVFKYRFQYIFTLSVNVFATIDNLDFLKKLAEATELPSKLRILNAASLAVLNTGPPTDLSTLEETEFEFRAQQDYFMAFGSDVDDTVGEIAVVDIDAVVNGKAENIHKP